jgi:hypothetical protein
MKMINIKIIEYNFAYPIEYKKEINNNIIILSYFLLYN